MNSDLLESERFSSAGSSGELESLMQEYRSLPLVEQEMLLKEFEEEESQRRQEELRQDAATREASRLPIWVPFAGTPQEMAYHSLADEMFYGGAGGGGKTDLLLGLAGTAHRNSIIFRRTFPETKAMTARSREIYEYAGAFDRADYNDTKHLWKLVKGDVDRYVEFGSAQHPKDLEKYRGRPHDLYAFDEVTAFTEKSYHFLTAWLRTTIPGQRCRIVATGNPPTSVEGEWVIRYWAPWIDKHHPDPAKPGELRWFVRVGERDIEVPDSRPVPNEKGELLYPRSRTFVPALLKDNPVLNATPAYMAKLQSQPEPLRSQMLYGDFSIGVQDDRWQVIPTAWAEAAMKRWKPEAPQQMDALGVDVASGGLCKTVIAPRHGVWFGPLVKIAGQQTPDGATAAHFVVKEHQPGVRINVDAIGYGSSCYERLRDDHRLGRLVHPVNNGEPTMLYDRSGKFRLVNVRAASYWRLREALDPENPNVLQRVALPPDRELLADLCAVRYRLQGEGIILEKKIEVEKRIGRSPDCGDAVVMAHWIIWDGRVEGNPVLWPPAPGSPEAKELRTDYEEENIVRIDGMEIDFHEKEWWEQ